MADGDVLTLDSAQPGGSGAVQGETKFIWQAPGGAPTLLLDHTQLIAAGDFQPTPNFIVPVGLVVSIWALITDAITNDELGWAFDTSRQQVYLNKPSNTAGEWCVRMRNDDGGSAKTFHVKVYAL